MRMPTVNSPGPAVDKYYNERWFLHLMGEAVFVKAFFVPLRPRTPAPAG